MLLLLLSASMACRRETPAAEQKIQRGGELLQEHPEQALAEFEEADKLGGPGAKLGIAMAHEQLGQNAEAEKVLLDALASTPDDLDARLALVRVRIALGRLDEARAELQKTLGHQPPHIPSLLLFAALSKTSEQGDVGQKALSAVGGGRYATLRASAEYAVAEAALLQARGDSAGASGRLAQANTSRSMSPQLAVALSDSLKIAKRLREAEWLLDRAASDSATPEIVNERLAMVAMDLGHLALAERALSKLRTEFKPDPRALLLQARLYDLRDDKEGSARASGRALDALPSDVEAAERRKIELAHVDALIRSGQEDKARATLRKMLESDAKFSPAKVILAALLLSDGKGGEALELVTPLLAEPALAQQAYPVAVAAHRQAGKLDEAERVAKQFHEQSKGTPRAAAVLAEVLAAQSRPADALSVVDAALKKHPNEPQLVAAKVDLTEKAQGLPAAIQVATALAEADKGSAGWLRLAALYSRHSRDADAVGVLRRTTERFPKDTRGWAELSAAEARLGNHAEAARGLEKLIELVPFDTAALGTLGTLYKKLGRTDDAQRAYEKVLEVEPSSLVPLNNLAVLLTGREGQATRAVELARQARAVAANDPSIADTLGWALVHTGDPKDLEEALALLQGSSKQLRVSEVYYHYGVALKRAGRDAEALVELERALQKGDFPGADRARELVLELKAK
jgi:tetratricopeptide (TPR) repeat protein